MALAISMIREDRRDIRPEPHAFYRSRPRQDDVQSRAGPPLAALMVYLADGFLQSVDPDVRRMFEASQPLTPAKWHGRDFLDALQELRALTGDDFLGLGATSCAPGAGAFIIELGARCVTLREALANAIRFLSMATTALTFSLREADGFAFIEMKQAASDRDPACLLTDWTMVVWHKLAQWLINEEIWLEEAEFDHALSTQYCRYAEMFGSECLFNRPSSRLVFKADYLDRRVQKTPDQAARLYEKTPGYFINPEGCERPWRLRVLAQLREEIEREDQLSSLEDIADRYGVSSQTVRRRLRIEGSSYRELKVQAREEVVLDMLSNGNATIGQASIRAGFAEPNGLARALRSSRGLTVRELRNRVDSWAQD